MDVREAYKIISKRYPDKAIPSCVEYRSCFVFQVVPKQIKPGVDYKGMFDTLRSVSKKTGEVKVFQPFHIPIAEYERGEEILNFK